MKFKQAFAAVALLASPAIMAGELTGNVGVVSDYMFRGIDQSASGAAVQGGVDYATDLGIYTGLWVTNSAAGGGNEADIYAGYGLKLGEFTLDTGAIYYAYTEDTEGSGKNTDYAELYIGGGIGPLSVKVFYAPEFGGDTGGAVSGDPDKNELLYLSVSATLNLNETLSFVPQLGFSAGDGVKDAFGDEYNDYSLTAIKKLKDDLSVSLAVVGSDRDGAGVPASAAAGTSDNPKFVIGFKKNFKI